MARLRERVVVEVAKLGVGGIAARALEPRLRLRDLGEPGPLRHGARPHRRAASRATAACTAATAACCNYNCHVRPRSHESPRRGHRRQLVLLLVVLLVVMRLHAAAATTASATWKLIVVTLLLLKVASFQIKHTAIKEKGEKLISQNQKRWPGIFNKRFRKRA